MRGRAQYSGHEQQRVAPGRPPGRLRGQRRQRGQRGQRGQRQDPTFAAVVCPQDQDHVLERHDDHPRPEDGRDCTDDVHGIEGDGVVGVEDLLDRVEGTRADVAVDDPEGPQREDAKALPARCDRGVLKRCRDRHGRPSGCAWRVDAALTESLAAARRTPSEARA